MMPAWFPDKDGRRYFTTNEIARHGWGRSGSGLYRMAEAARMAVEAHQLDESYHQQSVQEESEKMEE